MIHIRTPEEAVEEYRATRGLYEDLTQKLRVLLREILRINRIDYDAIEGRAKEVDRFWEKITRPGKQYADPLAEVTDLCGIRVVLYYREAVDAISPIIEREFEIDRDNSMDKGALLQPHEFGYRSLHYVVWLPPSRAELTEWKRFKGLKAEIQVRTVLQHSWASISRAFQYTRAGDAPPSLERKLFRLSGLLEIADEEFSELRSAYQAVSTTLATEIVRGNVDLTLDVVSLENYAKHEPQIIEMLRAAREIGFTLLDERDSFASEFLSYCSDLGVTRIAQLSRMIFDERECPRSHLAAQFGGAPGQWRVTPSFLVLLLLIRVRRDHFTMQYLTDKGWNRAVAERVLSVAARGGR